MKYLVILSFATLAAAAKLEKVYLPPNVVSASGAEAGLQTPFGPSERAFGPFPTHQEQKASQIYASQGERYANQAEILKFENVMNEDGFRYAYETSNGIKAEQEGRVIPGSLPEQGSLLVTGSYSYIGDDGQTYTVTYVADENGFQATGDHLPTPPPVPEAILRSLQVIKSNGIYSSHKSSYDADAGY